MKIWRVLVMGMCLVLMSAAAVLADDAVSEEGGIGSLVWEFLNSPMGISAVVFVLSFILGKIFTKKPKWKTYVERYRPLILQAVKMAERAIPDDVEDRGLARLNSALNYVLKVESKLDQKVLRSAISAVHAEAETNKNI